MENTAWAALLSSYLPSAGDDNANYTERVAFAKLTDLRHRSLGMTLEIWQSGRGLPWSTCSAWLAARWTLPRGQRFAAWLRPCRCRKIVCLSWRATASPPLRAF